MNFPSRPSAQTIPAKSRRTGTLALGLLVGFAPIPLVACGAQANGSDATDSTDTGNPPVIVDQKLRVEATDTGVIVSGEAGAVSAGARVEVTNLQSNESQSTTADDDGSFEVELDGSVNDEYRVEAELGGRTSSTNVGAGNGAPGFVDKVFLLDTADGFTPVENTTVRLSFTETEISFSGGCNSHFAEYTLCDGNLCTEGFGSTAIGCSQELHAQDDWLAMFFGSTPEITYEADRLTFENDSATLEFLDREVADPDRPLTGRTWTIDTFITGDAASNFPLQNEPTVMFDDDGTFDVFDTCNNGSGAYVVDGQTLTFSNVSYTDVACDDGADAARDIIGEVFNDGDVTFEIDAARLTLTRGDVGLGATTE